MDYISYLLKMPLDKFYPKIELHYGAQYMPILFANVKGCVQKYVRKPWCNVSFA